jgi:SOS-response transcriptional repressor LexA
LYTFLNISFFCFIQIDSESNSNVFLFIVNWAATLKKIKKDGDNIYLLPESKDDYHKPIILSEDDNLMINGKIVDVFNF